MPVKIPGEEMGEIKKQLHRGNDISDRSQKTDKD